MPPGRPKVAALVISRDISYSSFIICSLALYGKPIGRGQAPSLLYTGGGSGITPSPGKGLCPLHSRLQIFTKFSQALYEIFVSNFLFLSQLLTAGGD